MENNDKLQDYRIELLEKQLSDFKKEMTQDIKDINKKVTKTNEDILLINKDLQDNKKEIKDIKYSIQESNTIIKALNDNMAQYQSQRSIEMSEFRDKIEQSNKEIIGNIVTKVNEIDNRLKPIEKDIKEREEIKSDLKKSTIKTIWDKVLVFIIGAVLMYLGLKK